ncbi:MAG: clostripain-related cysteine peptidase [Planctomycetota bacterium]|nr:clostripain-related cysteine peptidase [Planctomycetota bacterium]
MLSDDTDKDAMPTRQMREALDAAGVRLDLIGFDACLMGMIEVAYELKDIGASVMVASEKTEPGPGWPYDTILRGLVANPSWTPAQLASRIVDAYYESYGGETMAAFDLSRIGSLAEAVWSLADALRLGWKDGPSAAREAAAEVFRRFDGALIRERHGEATPGARGLAIYMPRKKSEFDAAYCGETIRFAADGTWDEFLAEYYRSMKGSWVETARREAQEFATDPWAGRFDHVDLLDLCARLGGLEAGGLRASASPDTGLAPLTVNFHASAYGDAAGSEDGNGMADPGATFEYLWDFGDGTSSVERCPVHVFSAQGTYHVKVSARNSAGTVRTAFLTVTVMSGAMNIERAAIRLVFNKNGKDSIFLSGPLPSGRAPTGGKTIILDLGGVVAAGTFDERGGSKARGPGFRIAVRGGAFVAKLKCGDWKDELKDDGLADEDARSKPAEVPVLMTLGPEQYMGSVAGTWTARKYRKGMFVVK